MLYIYTTKSIMTGHAAIIKTFISKISCGNQLFLTVLFLGLFSGSVSCYQEEKLTQIFAQKEFSVTNDDDGWGANRRYFYLLSRLRSKGYHICDDYNDKSCDKNSLVEKKVKLALGSRFIETENAGFKKLNETDASKIKQKRKVYKNIVLTSDSHPRKNIIVAADYTGQTASSLPYIEKRLKNIEECSFLNEYSELFYQGEAGMKAFLSSAGRYEKNSVLQKDNTGLYLLVKDGKADSTNQILKSLLNSKCK